MSEINSFLCCCSLETGIVFMLFLDILHFIWHLFIFLPEGKGREIYIYQSSFNMDADLFLFYTTNLALLGLKIVYGVKVVQRKFIDFTNTLRAITNVSNLLIVFLDAMLALYSGVEEGIWTSFIFVG